jgi:hypothetical protein
MVEAAMAEAATADSATVASMVSATAAIMVSATVDSDSAALAIPALAWAVSALAA